jgi:hypothetical protein
MWKRLTVFGALALAGVTGAMFTATAFSDYHGNGNSGPAFLAELSGDNEIPAVETDTGGLSRVKFSQDLSRLNFMLVVDKGIGITMAHIHCGAEDENGPVAVWMAGQHPALDGEAVGWDVDGIWVGDATVTDANVVPTDCGQTLEELAQAMADGNMYVNVHSVEFPAGVVRGQLR